MAVLPKTLKVYEQNRLDRAIDAYARLDNPTIADLNFVRTQASVQDQIEQYRLGALGMNEQELMLEQHDSERLSKFMEAAGDSRPNEYCHCHAMIAGTHKDAATLRAVMASVMMRKDDPRNGCYLPANTAARKHMPHWLRNAVPHSRIHRKSCYRWMNGRISFNLTKTIEDLSNQLKLIRSNLQKGTIPPEILLEMRQQKVR